MKKHGYLVFSPTSIIMLRKIAIDYKYIQYNMGIILGRNTDKELNILMCFG